MPEFDLRAASILARFGLAPEYAGVCLGPGQWRGSGGAIVSVNPANGATRFVNPATGRSVVIDNVTNVVIHVGGDGFAY